MKVLIIHNTYQLKGGEDTTVSNEIELLTEKGENVSLLTFNNESKSMIFSLFFNIKSLHLITSRVREFKPDVIHVHNFFYQASPSIFYLNKKYNIPIIVTIHNFRLICSGSYLLREAKVCDLCVKRRFPWQGIRHACFQNSSIKTTYLTFVTGVHKLFGTWNRRISGYIALTPFAKDKLINSSLKLTDNQIFIKPNFVYDYGFYPKEKRKDFFLFVGRLSLEKGILILLKSWNQVNIPLVIIGDGPLRIDVLKATAQNPNIRYVGLKEKPEVNKYLSECKALVFPSIWFEGMPLVILEAFSFGTPVLCSNIDNLNDIVLDNYNGKLFKVGCDKSIFSMLNLLDLNSTHYENARQTFIDKYSKDANYNTLIEIYKSTILNKSKIDAN